MGPWTHADALNQWTAKQATERVAQEAEKKRDKPRAWLVLSGFAKALAGVIAVGTYGAKKHAPDAWKGDGFTMEDALDACGRHMLKFASGEAIDPEHGESHLAAAAWNLLAAEEKRLKASERVTG